MRELTKDELNKIIENHSHWLKEDCDGWKNMKADLSGVNLSGVNLSGAFLYGANLIGANLISANLHGAVLSRADLTKANLARANLTGANLTRADLIKANLYETNLTRANLIEANLYEANLTRTNLTKANLTRANLIRAILDEVNLELELMDKFFPLVCPESGSFVGWKKCRDGMIVKLEICENAKRSSALSRKCRCSAAKVLEIQDKDGNKANIEFAVSIIDNNFIYRVGETISIPDFDEDRRIECSTGIHFFITRQEAVDYMP